MAALAVRLPVVVHEVGPLVEAQVAAELLRHTRSLIRKPQKLGAAASAAAPFNGTELPQSPDTVPWRSQLGELEPTS